MHNFVHYTSTNVLKKFEEKILIFKKIVRIIKNLNFLIKI